MFQLSALQAERIILSASTDHCSLLNRCVIVYLHVLSAKCDQLSNLTASFSHVRLSLPFLHPLQVA